MKQTIIERIAEPVSGGRSILRETLFADGEQQYSVLRGSPAPTETVKAHEEVVLIDP